MTGLSRLVGLSLVALLISFTSYGIYQSGYESSDTKWKGVFADQQEQQAKALAAAVMSARAEEQNRQIAINQVRSDAKEQNKTATIDAARADAAGERLRIVAGQLAAGAGKCSNDSGVAERGSSAARAAMVLSDLFQRADKRAGELAKAYDAARIAGLACQSSYKSISM